MDRARRSVGDRLQSGLEHVKLLLEVQMKDPTMMQKILDIVNHFQLSTIQDREFIEFFSRTLIGPHLIRDSTKYTKFKFPRRIGKALFQLTDGARLSRIPDVTADFLDCSWIFDKMREAVAAVEENARDSQDIGAFEPLTNTDLPTYMRRPSPQGTSLAPTGEPASDLEQDIKRMLGVLEPIYDILDQMPPKFMTEKMGISIEDQTMLKMRVGSAALAIKVHDISQLVTKKPARAALVGPESIGKSTAINHLVSDGRGEPFMHVADGMGTQMICIVSHGAQERLQMGSKALPRHCKVQEVLKEQCEIMSQGKSDLSSLEALRATKPFRAPMDVELIDVPGIKQSKQLESSLALSIASVLVICLGPVDKARGSLKGDLKLLPPIVENLERDVPILCMVTRAVSRDVFDATRDQYRDLLKEYFPRSQINVMWANFHDMKTLEEKQAAVSNFYNVVNKFPVLESNPYKVFLALEPQVKDLTRKLSTTLNDVLKPYFSDFEKHIDQHVIPSLNNYHDQSTLASVKEDLDRTPVGAELDQVLVEEMPCFSVMLNSVSIAEVPDEALIAQELLLECRLAVVRWLTKQGVQLHDRAIDQHLYRICQLAVPQVKDENERDWELESKLMVCDKLCQTIESRKSHIKALKNTDKMDWWQVTCCNRLGKYLRYASFPWIVTGFYLVTVDERIKFELLNRFLKNTHTFSQIFQNEKPDWVRDWKKQLLACMKHVNFKDWVKKCRAHQNPSAVYKEIFVCMEQACDIYRKMALDLKVVTSRNVCIDHLLEVSFVMVQRLFVRKPAQVDIQFTSFADHLRKDAKQVHELSETLAEMEKASPAEVVLLCTRALELMRESNGDRMEEWRHRIADMEASLPEMSHLIAELTTDFQRHDDNVLLVSGLRYDGDQEPRQAPRSAWQCLSNDGWKLVDVGFNEMLHKAAAAEKAFFYFHQPMSGDICEVSERDAQKFQTGPVMKGDRMFKVSFDTERAKDQVPTASVVEIQTGGGFADDDMSTNFSAASSSDGNNARKASVQSSAGAASGVDSGQRPLGEPDKELEPAARVKLVREGLHGASAPQDAPVRRLRCAPMVSGMVPEHVASAVQRVSDGNHFPVHVSRAESSDERAFGKAAIEEARQHGSKVVVYVRCSSVFTYDPDGFEQPFLEELSREPNVSACFVLWRPVDGRSDWGSDSTTAKWQRLAGDVVVHLKPMCSSEDTARLDIAQFERDLFYEVKESTRVVYERLEEKGRKLREKTSVFSCEVRRFLDARSQDSQNGPGWFQQNLRTKVRQRQRALLEDFQKEASHVFREAKFEVPSAEFLGNQPQFFGGAIEDMGGGREAVSINEIRCRAFLFNVMVGQTMDKAAALADVAYDVVMRQVLNEVGRWFCMDGEVVLSELNEFCRAGKAKHQEEMLKDFLVKDNFVNMYVGCVLSTMVPMLYVTVLPALWDSAQGKIGEVTDKFYRSNFEKAQLLLQGN